MPTAVYKCNKCGYVFNNRHLAKECEDHHIEIEFILPAGMDEKGFCGECHYDNRVSYPSGIAIKKNGTIKAFYKLITEM